MTAGRVAFGKSGEDLACRELVRHGYAIVARRYRRAGGELDIVARDGATLVFVEVKARHGAAFGGAAEAITWMKRRRIVNLAREYISRHRLAGVPCRFDVVTVDAGGSRPIVEIIQNAFDAS